MALITKVCPSCQKLVIATERLVWRPDTSTLGVFHVADSEFTCIRCHATLETRTETLRIPA